MEIKPHVREEAVQINDIPWKPFPDALSRGGIRWKMLHASPEMGAWTAIFDCPAGSSFNAHFHVGPGEYLLTKGRMDVRGGAEEGGTPSSRPPMAMNPPTPATTRRPSRLIASST